MNRDFKGIWIPREIWLHKTLSLQAKVLWAEIWSLHDRDIGGCYASNDYLCEFMNVKISRLKEIMKELRDAGFLKDVSFDGRNRIVCALSPEINYGGQQTAGKPASCQPENRPTPTLSPYNIYNKEDNKDKREAVPATRPPSSSKKKSDPIPKKSVREHINLTDKQYQELLKKYGQEKLDWMLDFLDAKKGANGYDYKSDYHVLLPANWVNEAYEKEHSSAANSSESRIKYNRALAEKIWDQCKGRPQRDVELTGKYLEFLVGVNSPSVVLEFDRKDFRERAEAELRKRNIKLKE